MGHPTGTLVDRLSTSAHQHACAPECPDCVSPPLRLLVHSFMSSPEAQRSPALASHSAAVWSPTDHTSSLGLRFCPAGPRDGQGPSQACLQGHRKRGALFPKQGLKAFLRCREWGSGALILRAGSFPLSVQLRAWCAGRGCWDCVCESRRLLCTTGLTQFMLSVSSSKRP